MTSLPIAILAGGLATRMYPLTEKIPKSLLEVAGKPFAVHQIELLQKVGVTNIVFCVGYLGEKIESILGDGSAWNVKIRYVFDGKQLMGTGGALRRALPLLGDAFFVMYGDSYLECDYSAIEYKFLESRKLGLMTVYYNDDLWDRSNVLFCQGQIEKYDKRMQTPDMRHIDFGLGVFRAEALNTYPFNTPFDLATVYQDLLECKQLTAFEVHKRFYEIGSPEGFLETQKYLLTKGNKLL